MKPRRCYTAYRRQEIDPNVSFTFHTTLFKGTTKNVAGIVVPDEVVDALGGGKKPAVKITVAGYTYRSTVARMGERYMIGLSAEHRAASGLSGGDEVDVTLELDTEPRVTPVPDDLQAALAEAGKAEAFEALAASRKKEFVRQVEEAKTEATRLRRIAKVVEAGVVK